MKYVDLKVNLERPYIWKRPSRDKIKNNIISYNAIKKEMEEFDKLRETGSAEIKESIEKAFKSSEDKNELNYRLSELFEFYGKAIIPTDDIDSDFLLKKTNSNTLNKKLQPWCQNLVFNIPEVISSKPYSDFVGQFRDVPAFVVLAGPSLENNVQELKKAKGKSLIIAVDTSLRPLIERGIIPDIVVTHDANPNGCKFFLSKDHPYNIHNINFNAMTDEQIAMHMVELKQDTERLKFKYDVVGLFVDYCHPMTLLAFNGSEKRFYAVLDPSLPVYDMMAASTNYKIDESGNLKPENKGRIVGGSSVGHVAAYAAIAFGCNPISLVGLDLSYPGGMAYVNGASNNKDLSKQKLIELDDLSGNKVKTNMSMLSYKMVLERTLPVILSQNPKLRFYNCTEDSNGNPAGILEVGAEPKRLNWVIDNFCKSEVKLNGTKNI